MRLYVNKAILGVEGKKIDGEDKKPVTLASVAVTALLAAFHDERDMTGEKKSARFKLAMRILKAKDKPLEILTEEASELKLVIGKAYGPLIVGRAYEIIEGREDC